MKLLQIDSSPLGDASVSRQLTAAVTAAVAKAHPGLEVVTRDVAAQPLPHLDGELLQVVKFSKNEGLSPRQQEEFALNAQVLEELFGADVVVIGAPLYNFSIPTQLKAYIDRLCQVGKTFRYSETGPIGLAGGRKVIIVSTRGGVYSSSPQMTALEHQESYLKTVLGFIGITDVSIVRAEGVNMGPEAKAKALDLAHQQIAALTV